MQKLRIITAIILLGILCAGCTKEKPNNPEKVPQACVLASSYSKDLNAEMQLLCINKVQYIQLNGHVTAYWNTDDISLDYPYLRRCSCEE